MSKKEKKKAVTLSMTQETQDMAERDSLKWNEKNFVNRSNISGYVSYLINKANKEWI